jgi:tRNA pseudouridine38-40 synthase
MPRFAFLIEYDGAPFAGWQRQTNAASVQGAIETALAKLEPRAHLLAAAGRTDTGVHGIGQVAHIDLDRDWDTFRLLEALNAHLRPQPVAIRAVRRVADDFHARFSAVERRYLYRILNRRAPAVLERGRVWTIKSRLDVAAMAEGAGHLVGHHDFTTFRSTYCQANSPVKTLDEISFSTIGEEIHVRLRARSFLHNQVRSIMGSLVQVGLGSWAPDDVARALVARDRSACGPVAPSQGLYLTGVSYPDDPFADFG